LALEVSHYPFDITKERVMSHLVLTAVGGDITDTARLDDRPEPTLGPDGLLVAVDAAPVNPADLLYAAGWFALQPAVPAPLGAEGVGRVIEAGSSADRSLVGQRVIILPTFEQGTWADRVVVPARNVVPIGEQGDTLQLAMLAVNPATAYALLNQYVTVKPGDWIGQTLGGSAVGQYVTALAHRAGVRTLSVVRRDDPTDRLRALGGDLVLVDGPDLAARIADALGDARLRLVLDGVGGSKVADLVGSIESGGTVVSYSSQTGEAPVLPLADLIYRDISLRSFFIVNWVRHTPRKQLEQTYAELAHLVADGGLNAAVEATYPLTEYRTALAHAQQPKRSGKVLFTPNGPAR
jgi:NADPH:quinone reductase-like Zn-dependent oxidoreductase